MGAVNTTYTFTATDTITSTKMNNIIDQTTITGDAIFGTTLEVATGKLKVRSQGITSNELANNSVTTGKIADSSVSDIKIAANAVTTGKIADSSVSDIKIAANAVTTAKVLDANITPAKLSQPLTSTIAQNSTSGTRIDFLSIPSWVSKISITFSSVSTSGTSNLLVQLGDSGGIETTGYNSVGGDFNGNTAEVLTGLVLDRVHSASAIFKGDITLRLLSGTTWISSGVLAYSDATYGATVANSAGEKTLSNALDRIRVTTVNGSDTFDLGKINIMYE